MNNLLKKFSIWLFRRVYCLDKNKAKKGGINNAK